MAIRRPELEDTRAIATVHVRAWQAAYAGIMPADFLGSLAVEASEARWSAWLASPEHRLLVVETGGVVVGFCSFGSCRDADTAADLAEVHAINLHPDCWRRGLGSELLTAVLGELRQSGFSAAILWVITKNERARRFYEAHGWYADGEEKMEGPRGCPPIEHLRYRIELDD